MARPRSRLWLAWLVRDAVATILASEMVVLAAMPWNPSQGAALSFLLLLPLTLAAVLLLEGAALLRRRVFYAGRLRAWLTDPGRAMVGLAAFLVLAPGMYLSNRLLVDEWFDPITRLGYVTVIVLAGLAAYGVSRCLRQPWVGRALSRAPRWAPAAISLLLIGISLPLLDAKFLPAGYPLLHVVPLLGAVLAFVVLAVLLVQYLRPLPCSLATLVGFAALSTAVMFSEQPSVRLVGSGPPGLYARVLDFARDWTDRDGDGHSAWFGGGDCDDGNPTVHPLSLSGRDCLGWLSAAPTTNAAPPMGETTSGPRPEVVVLLTIDTFRCGFGRFDRPELRDICPFLTRMATSGAARYDVRGSPLTRAAIAAMFSGGPGHLPLNVALTNEGYRRHAIATHLMQLTSVDVSRGFSSIDKSLIPAAAVTNGSTAAGVTDRALAWLQAADRTQERAFLWAHYYDPHAPYVSEAGAVFVLDRLASYAAEVRRTDGEIARLLDGIGALTRAPSTLVIVTGDHGEEFGEHGHFRHYTSLRDEAVRIPFIAWSPGPQPKRFIPAELPSTPSDLGPFMRAVVAGAPFQASREVFLHTPFLEDPQIGVVLDGWKLVHHIRFGHQELFDLRSDPFELKDRSLLDPDRVRMLGQRLGPYVRQSEPVRNLITSRP
jgi:choline-sulfatase